jgi:PhoH-like ATPase
MGAQYKVIDTNVLLSDISALDSFQPKKPDTVNYLVVSMQTLRELDGFAKEPSERGADSRAVLRRIKELRQVQGGTLYDGVPLSGNRVLVSSARFEDNIVRRLCKSTGDFHHDLRIMQVAQNLRDMGEAVEFITNDSGAYDIAGAFGISVDTWRDFESGMPKDLSEAYKGWRYAEAGRSVVGELDRLGFVEPAVLGLEGLFPNEFVILKGGQIPKTPLVFDAEKNLLVRLTHFVPDELSISKACFKRKDITVLQQCYIHALRNPVITIVFAIGPAGTSKTFWATYAGVEQTFSSYGDVDVSGRDVYSKMIITHPNIPVADSPELGYLPGSLDEKMEPWMGGVNDNLEQIWPFFKISLDVVDELKSKGDLEVLALAHARGRTFPNRFWIIDEAQNVTRPQMKTLITRIGSASKIVLTGDPEQCDLKGVTAVTNTIVWASEKFKDYGKSATIVFSDDGVCVRSELAEEAIKRL